MRAVTDIPPPPPTLPRRGPLLLAFAAIMVGGAFGALIGYGLADISSKGTSGMEAFLGALIGAVIGAGGIGIVAVLTLRAMAEWKRHPASANDLKPPR